MKKKFGVLGAVLLSANQMAMAQKIDAKSDTMSNVIIDQVTVSSMAAKKYNVTEISESMRLQKDILRATQNVQILNQSVLKDQHALNVNESVTRNVSGTFREELHNGISSDIFSRGGYINAQRNGVDLRPLLKGPLGDDISIIENIEFLTGNVKHNLVTGVDYNNKTNKTQDTWNTATTIYPLSISNPVYSNVINNNSIGGNYDSENIIDTDDNLTNGHLYYISPYVSDEIGLLSDKLRVNAGLRMTYSHSNFNQYGDKTKGSDFVLSPRIGANYMYAKRASVYALFDNTFLPLTGKTFEGQELKPVKGRSYEVGLKNEWNESFSTSLSVYKIYRSNIVVKDPATNDLYQSGENKAEGVEFDLRGRVVKGLNMIVNYAFTDSKITKDEENPQMVGKATPNRIKHIQNTWLVYTLPGKVLEDFSVSVGYQYMAGRTERFTSAEPAPMKDLFRMDSGIAYARNKVAVNLTVNNILNSHQYSTAWKRNDMYYWVQLAPINYRVSVTLSI